MPTRCALVLVRATVIALAAAPALAGGTSSFWNFESPHVHPLDLTPDGTTLLVVNTADDRLEVFTVSGRTLVAAGSVPVGMEPVSVRARTNDEAWVVNHVSDSISIVDLGTLNVTATITTLDLPDGLGDEPCDVVFAGTPQRAFVTVSQLNTVKVYDPADLAASPAVLPIAGEDPRALATDGTTVWAAVFESGNDTTIIDEFTVSSPLNPYPGDTNPPPNDGAGFDPPLTPGLPTAPPTSLIVRKDAGGAWRDDSGTDWSAAVTWDLHDHDLAVIDADTLAVSYVTGLMNVNMAVAARPGGDVLVVGTEAFNEVRFEPNVNARFLEVRAALVGAGGTVLADLNPHLDYTTTTVPQPVREQSLGDPRAAAWSADGTRAYVAGLGSNNLVVLDAALARVGRVDVGEGPTGVAVNDGAGVVYVLNRFEATVSIVDVATVTENERIGFHDATPMAIRVGRPHLYDTHETSGLGHVSCASCHVDGRMDQVAWDLGNPAGTMQVFNEDCVDFQCEDWHPMKGPMTTQTLVGIADTRPLHWRGDRPDLAAFDLAYVTLQGADAPLTPEQMQQFEAFTDTFQHPPNPYRNFDGSLATLVPNGGNAVVGEDHFLFGFFTSGGLCATCHTVDSGAIPQISSGSALLAAQQINVPQLRNLYEKTGFDTGSAANNRGFGFMHDGHAGSIVSFLEGPRFNFAPGGQGVQQRLDLEAYMLSFSFLTHAATGAQVTVGAAPSPESALRDDLIALLDVISGFTLELVVHGREGDEMRGWVHTGGGVFQSNRASETTTLAALDVGTGPGTERTYTLVPFGTEQRVALDRDDDGFFDGDEIDACSDPEDATSTPGVGGCCPGDTNGDLVVDVDDLVAVISVWGSSNPNVDVDGNGVVDVDDLVAVIIAWGPCPG